MSVNITKEAIMDNISEIPEEFVVEAEYTEEELKRLKAAADKKAAAAAALVSETPDKKTGHLPDPFMTEAAAEDDEPEMKPVATPKRKGGAILWGVAGITLAAAAILLFVFLWNPERHDVVTTTEAATTAVATEAPTEATAEVTTVVATEDTAEATTEEVTTEEATTEVPTTEEVTTEEATTVAIPDIKNGEPVELNEAYFPDRYFREYIRELADTDQDGVLSATEYRKVTEINISLVDLASLKGVEFFPELTKLYCENTDLMDLDVSKNTKLRDLECCQNMYLQTINLGDIDGLTLFECYNGKLTSLDVSKLVYLELLSCYGNKISELDVSNCKALRTLYCANNQLTELDISNNTFLEAISCHSNPLKELDVRNNSLLVRIDSDPKTKMIYNETVDPNQEGGIPVDEEHFPDGIFRNAIRNEIDPNHDGYLSKEELDEITFVVVNGSSIKSLQGIEYFPELVYLDCSNCNLTELDISKNPKLADLYCHYNALTELDLSHNPELLLFGCMGNKLAMLDLSHNAKLVEVNCANNKLKTLDVSHNPDLSYLSAGWNRISTIDLSQNYMLRELDLCNLSLKELNVSANPYLETIVCYKNNITTLDVSENAILKSLKVDTKVQIFGSAQGVEIEKIEPY